MTTSSFRLVSGFVASPEPSRPGDCGQGIHLPQKLSLAEQPVVSRKVVGSNPMCGAMPLPVDPDLRIRPSEAAFDSLWGC
jgi:hypothetical protein